MSGGKVDEEATREARLAHAAGVRRLNALFAYDRALVFRAPRQVGYSRRQRREWMERRAES